MDIPSPHILLVEDDEDDYRLTVRMLQESGGEQVQLDWATTYEQALESIRRQQHQVYLIDLRLGQHTGLDLVCAAAAQGCTAPLIILTGSTDQGMDIEAMHAGATDYLVKDQIGAKSLERAIRYALSKAQALAALRESNKRYRLMAEVAPEAIVTTNDSGQIIFANRAAEQIFGYTHNQLQGLPISLLIPQAITQLLVNAPSSQEPQMIELSGTRQDGSKITLEMSLGMQIERNNRMYTVIVRDTTNRRQLETHMQELEKMALMGELTGSIVHDFNNLLTGIMSFSELLLYDFDSFDPRRTSAEQILSAVRRGSNLTQQLLAIIRRQVLQPVAVDVNQLLEDMRPLLKQLLGSTIALAVLPAPGRAYIRAVPSELEQVIMNLIMNARDAMPRGGTLTIRTDRLSPTSAQLPGSLLNRAWYILLEVSDTGAGMDAETQARMFEPFFTTKAPGKGTGIGLTTIHRIVHQLGGDITVESAVGQGTSLQVFFPLEVQE